MSQKYYTYILKSDVDSSRYFGHTSDLEERLKRHNSGKVTSTKSKRPWRIHYFEEFATKSDAYRRELYFKSFAGYKYLKDSGVI